MISGCLRVKGNSLFGSVETVKTKTTEVLFEMRCKKTNYTLEERSVKREEEQRHQLDGNKWW